MATIIDIVTQAIAPHIKAPYELVDVEYGKMGGDDVLSIFVDKEGGISLNDTVELSEVISPLLDHIQPDPFPAQYMLEVTSPGLERPLKNAEAVAKAVGQYIHVKLYQAVDKSKVFEGTLLSFEHQELVIEYLDKTRTKQVTIPYQTVAKARLAVKI
ncbi:MULTISPECIES: ribosome maturation factor RimP [unclassified Streptococcus]|uniref:ribosome maturation factor RimP n=1 Tax=unclassified Streptococcus TaxID=2608887 RepID=UPI001071F1D9|nr:MULTISPECIES: ribosome maturation factor RimP [unclassified Streptococcus]MBF0787695.1 ribosome maturation factor RimP [Streptococcus sp. 19428wC2_LYSM12]MCQ9211234.1 ribosome maturation factor RimP [Streptococcus sp. B01]MCQ9214547.1 ribosome maturation factor RimP [Streptococcus sp. O1]TFV05304.1 ribosome maturation factor RimP [Streptococcus sp. LYSM12]